MAAQEYKNEQHIPASGISAKYKETSTYSDPAFNMDARNPGGASAQGKVSTSSQNEKQCTSENEGPKA